jgi:hypothetical protein
MLNPRPKVGLVVHTASPTACSPEGDGVPVDDEPPQRVVQPAHHGDVGDRVHDVEPGGVERQRPQHGRERPRGPRGPEPPVRRQRRERHLHGGVVTAPDADGELVEARDDARGGRAGQRPRAQAVVPAEVGDAAVGAGPAAGPGADRGEPAVHGGAPAGGVDDQVAAERARVRADAAHPWRVTRIGQQARDLNPVPHVDARLGRGRAPQHPVDGRAARHEQGQPVVAGCGRAVGERGWHLGRHRRLRDPGRQQGGVHVGQPLAQDLAVGREHHVRLDDVRRGRPQRVGGGGLDVGDGREVGALDDRDRMSGAGEHQRRGQARRAPANHGDAHAAPPPKRVGAEASAPVRWCAIRCRSRRGPVAVAAQPLQAGG